MKKEIYLANETKQFGGSMARNAAFKCSTLLLLNPLQDSAMPSSPPPSCSEGFCCYFQKINNLYFYSRQGGMRMGRTGPGWNGPVDNIKLGRLWV